MRAAAGDALPPMKRSLAIRAFTCGCQQIVEIGQAVYFDGCTRRWLCSSCGTLPSFKNVQPILEPDDWQLGYNRMRALENLPGPLKPNLQIELDALRSSYCRNSKHVEVEVLPNDEWLHGMYAKRLGHCNRCGARQEVGTFVAWHRARKVIICSSCLL